MSKVEDKQENVNICLNNCASCMSYPGIESEILFCARGKSSTPITKKGCNCGFCEVQMKYGCTELFHCDKGSCK